MFVGDSYRSASYSGTLVGVLSWSLRRLDLLRYPGGGNSGR